MNAKTNAHTQHSQGPWFFDSHCADGMAIRPARKSDGGKTGFLLACVYGSDDQCDGMFEYCGGSQKGNARLIAAAPELLKALRDLVEITEPLIESDGHRSALNFYDYARDAIAKATGESA